MVLDPGHSGGPNFDSTAEVDGPKPVTALGITFHPVNIDDSGIMSIDNGGAPGERVTMWQAALRIQKILRSAGYIVDLTKSSANENVGLLERVREAIDDHATIAVSLHYTGGIPFGEANAHFGVTPQQVGRYRTNVSNGDTIRFTNGRVAAESQRDAKFIQRARAAAGDGVDVAPLDESFPESRGLPAYGNISIVQVVDQRFPWIYNEDGDVGFNFRDYTTGIANGIERAVPIATCLRPHATAAPARSSEAAQSSVRSCAGGRVQDVPYFTVKAHRTTCAVAQRLIRAFLCVNSSGERCERGNHWYPGPGALYGRWTSPSGWHCTARFPVLVNEDGRPYGHLRCGRGPAWVSAQVFG